MNLISPGNVVPSEVARVLLPHEHNVIMVRQHPATLGSRIIVVLGGLAISVYATVKVGMHLPETIVWLLVAYLIVDLMLAALRWLRSFLVLTSQRLIVWGGPFRGIVETIPISELKRMTINRSYCGRMWGYGSLAVQKRQILDYIPYPQQIYLEAMGLVYPGIDDS